MHMLLQRRFCYTVLLLLVYTFFPLEGTGFRSLSRLGDTVGGSCNTTDSVGQYKLRLTLYVCNQTEVTNGKCGVCRTKGCYLKGKTLFLGKYFQISDT